MKFIIDAIDGDESKINFIVYPYITRIYASAFYQKYLELFLEVKINDNQQIKVSGFKSLFQYRKRLWQFSQNFMLKYLYFVIAKKNYSKFNEICLNEKINIYFEDIGEKNEKEIIELVNSNILNKDNKESIYYYCLVMPQQFLNLQTLKSFILKNENKYPVLSTYFSFKEKIENGKSFLNKLKNIIYINDFENPLLYHYYFIERISRKDANKKIIESEIEKLKDKIININEKFTQFKKIWNEDFSNYRYPIENQKLERIKIIKSSSILEDFLLDNKKDIAGRQIQEIYKLLIKEQNKFIGEIVNIFKKQINKERKINKKKIKKKKLFIY